MGQKNRFLGCCYAVWGLIAGECPCPAKPGEAIRLREQASLPVTWQEGNRCDATIAVQLLAINDFHGQITTGQEVDNRPVGSAPVWRATSKKPRHAGLKQPFSSMPATRSGLATAISPVAG
jgi:hypothetical protein